MLVLSRRSNESITIPGTGIHITVLRVSGNRVRLGIEAPSGVEIRRSELVPADADSLTEFDNAIAP